jgi:hypothetical protein
MAALIQNTIAENCLFLLNGGSQEIVLVSGNSSFYSCTSAAASDLGRPTNCWGSDFSNIYIENCAMFGAQDLTAGSSPSTWTWVNCMADNLGALPGNPQYFTGIPTLVPYANQFVNTSFGAGDFRTMPGANLIGAGTPDLTHAPVDILGTARSMSWDIGAYETPSNIPPPPPPPTCPPKSSLNEGSGVLIAGLALAQAARRNRLIARRRFLDPRRW